MNRREFLKTTAAVGAMAGTLGLRADEKALPAAGKAKHCILLWLGGGMAQIDTFDPKRLGDAKKKVAGSYYPSIPTVVKDVQVCEHLQRTAKILDRCTIFRTVNHNVIDEHAAAANRMHTGRPTAGTIVYPSIGSLTAHQLGAAGDGVPAYVVMGYPNVSRGPGFLGAKHSYLYLTSTEAGPNGLSRPEHISAERQARREQLLERVRGELAPQAKTDKVLADYDQTVADMWRLAGPKFMNVFDLKNEPADLRAQYGGEFGQRCLLARRLVQNGVRFCEVSFNLDFINGTGWDTHNQGQLKQHVLIEELDKAFSTLVLDLEKSKLLDSTLVVIASEFGRPPEFDGGGGRGHQSAAFTVVTAGGGLKNGQAIGVTDDLSKKIVERPISVPDMFATLFWSMGINPEKYVYDGERPVPITDMGKPVTEAFAG